MHSNMILMIEGGQALEMVKEHIADRLRVRDEVAELAKELGAENVTTNRCTGALMGVVFQDKIHPDFCKPKLRDGASYPKKGTPWRKRLEAQAGYRDPSEWISSELGVPTSLQYSGNGAKGVRMIGDMLTACGFLYLSEDGPYALWIPDVPAEVAKSVAAGYRVADPARSFTLHTAKFQGCRRIEPEEWEILVLQHRLEQKQKSASTDAPGF